jgi:hypothetical protein
MVLLAIEARKKSCKQNTKYDTMLLFVVDFVEKLEYVKILLCSFTQKDLICFMPEREDYSIPPNDGIRGSFFPIFG